jgi:hypothetical protein
MPESHLFILQSFSGSFRYLRFVVFLLFYDIGSLSQSKVTESRNVNFARS